MMTDSVAAENEFRPDLALITTLRGAITEEVIGECLDRISVELKSRPVRVWCIDTTQLAISPDVALIGGYIAAFAEVNKIRHLVAISNRVSARLTERAMQLLTNSSIRFVHDRVEAEKEIASILRV